MAKWRGLIWKTNIDMMHLLWIPNIWNKELDYWYRQLVLLKNKSHRPYVMFHLPYPYQKRPWWKIEPSGLDWYVDCRDTKSSFGLIILVFWSVCDIDQNRNQPFLDLKTYSKWNVQPYFTTYKMDQNRIYCSIKGLHMHQNFVMELFEFHWHIHFQYRTLC